MEYASTLSNSITKYSDRLFFDLFLNATLDRLKCPQLCPRLLMPQATALATDSREKTKKENSKCDTLN